MFKDLFEGLFTYSMWCGFADAFHIDKCAAFILKEVIKYFIKKLLTYFFENKES